MGFQIGPLTIHYYGFIIMFGVFIAALLIRQLAKRRNLDPDLVWDGLIWVLIGGVLGARLWHVLTPPDSMVAMGITTRYYLMNPLEALAIWRGGLGFPGAVIGGVLAFFLFARRRKLQFPLWLDLSAPGLALGHAIGRWGNFVNQELYGAPSDLPWAIYIDPSNRLPGYHDISYYHPLFLYESLWNLANAGLLLWLGRRWGRKLADGDLFLMYLIIYPVGRFLLEFIRLDPARVGGLKINQTIMLIVALSAAMAIGVRRWLKLSPARRRKPAAS
jgi:phosphatidylglycerol:prolipoprotein diacylglycerol transferase